MADIQIIKNNNHYICDCQYDDRFVPKRAGFFWNRSKKQWETRNPKTALELKKYLSSEMEEEIKEDIKKREKELAETKFLTYNDKDEVFVWKGPYETKEVPKRAGFRWDGEKSRWWTSDPVIAEKLSERANEKALEQLTQTQKAVEDSKSASADIDIPKPENGMNFYPFQKAGIKYSLERDGVLIGDEMGLGKTIQAIGIINAQEYKKALIVCPASLKLNWKRECEQWLTNDDLTIAIENKKGPDFLEADIAIINYAMVNKYHDLIHSTKWEIVIMDEVHYLKNYKAQRTKALLGGKEDKYQPLKAIKKVALTGTPVLNRPNELWTVAKYLAPKKFSFWNYHKRYCDGHKERYGWDFSGASNLSELQKKLRANIMIRRKKEDVLKELPPKTRQLIPFQLDEEFDDSRIRKMLKKRHELRGKRDAMRLAGEDYKAVSQELQEAGQVAFEEIAKLRHNIAVAKIPKVIEYLENIFEAEEKVVCFVWHRDVANALKKHFKDKAVTLMGDTKTEARQEAVDRFQNDDDVKLFIGSITAAGVGITLTEASHVVFAEIDWVPANLSQAEDRCHRIGQEDNVLVQHLVVDNTIESILVNSIMEKQKVIDKALDDDIQIENDESKSLMNLLDDVAVTDEEKEFQQQIFNENKKYEEEQEKLIDLDDKKLVVQVARSIASVCDKASSKDEMGYNKYDAGFGHYVASLNPEDINARLTLQTSRMLLKYHNQIGEKNIDSLKEIIKKMN